MTPGSAINRAENFDTFSFNSGYAEQPAVAVVDYKPSIKRASIKAPKVVKLPIKPRTVVPRPSTIVPKIKLEPMAKMKKSLQSNDERRRTLSQTIDVCSNPVQSKLNFTCKHLASMHNKELPTPEVDL